MSTDEERLIVLVEARVRDLERNMAKASGTTGREFNKMRRHSASATKQMEQDMVRATTRINMALAATGRQIGALAASFAAPIAAGGIAGLTVGLNAAARSIATVADEAKRAGIDIKAFQELQYVAEQNRIGVDSLTDGIKELNLRADEFILTGQGSGAEAFQRLGFTAEDLSVKLQKPNELFIEIIGKLEQLDRAAQIRIADEIFGGTGGERFVQLIAQGEQGIRDTIDEANRLELIMSEGLIDAADDLDRKFTAVSRTVGVALKSAIVEAATALGRFIDEFRAFENRATDSLRSRLNFAERNLAEAQERRSSLPGFLGKPLDLQIERSQQEIEQLRAELRSRAEADLRLGLQRQRAQLENPVTSLVPPETGGGSGRSREAGRIERERNAVRELIAELEQELSLVHAGEQAKRAAEASRRAGAEATETERARIIALNEAIYQETEALEAAEQARQDFTEGMDQLSTDALDALGNVIAGTEDAADAFKKLAIEIVKSAITGKGAYSDLFASLNTGGGGIGGMLGGIFGGFKPNTTYGSFIGAPGYSMGTANTGGQRGEPRGIVHGQEAIIPLPTGGKVPVEIQGGAQNQPLRAVKVDVDVGVSIDEDGNLQGFVRRIAQREVGDGINRFDAALPDRLKVIENKPRYR